MESTSPFSRTERVTLVPGLRLRPVPELETCIVYRSSPPALLILNLSAWLVLEILTEKGDEQLWPDFYESVRHASTPVRAHKLMLEAIQKLADLGLVELNTLSAAEAAND